MKKQYLFSLKDKTKIFLVSGEYIRNNYYIEYNLGGHYLVYDWIPKGQIWLQEMSDGNEQMRYNLLHQIYEYLIMRYNKYDYEDAHQKRINIQKKFRKGLFQILKINWKNLKRSKND